METEKILEEYALSFIGVPYIYGGDDPIRGWDCSHYVIELLKSVGMLPNNYIGNSQSLFNFFFNLSTSKPDFGTLAFFGESVAKISHVGFCLNNKIMINAASGDSKTMTIQDAINANAFVKIRPITYRKDLVAFLTPQYDWLHID